MIKKSDNTLSSLDKLIEEEFENSENIKLDNIEPTDYLSFNNYALNYILRKNLKKSVGCGEITSLVGLSGTGKSLLAATLGLDPKVKRIIIFNTEGSGLGQSLLQHIGIKPELEGGPKINYISVETFDNYRISKESGKIESDVADKDMPQKLDTGSYIYHRGFNSMIKKILYNIQMSENKENVLLILDSIANLKPSRTILEGTSDMGLSGKFLNLLFAGIDNIIERTNVSFIFTNKVYTNFQNQYDPYIQSGGYSVVYNAHNSLWLSNISETDDLSDSDMKEEKLRRKTSLGMALKPIKITIKKSRAGTESRTITILLDATYGIVKHSGLFSLLRDFEIIKKINNRTFTIDGIDEFKSFNKSDFLSILLTKEDEFIDKIQSLLDEKEKQIKKERLNIISSGDLESEIEDLQSEDLLNIET